jgi:hypothetical protein
MVKWRKLSSQKKNLCEDNYFYLVQFKYISYICNEND